jgi:hypothetical protein
VGIGIGLVAVGAPLVLPLAALTFLAAFIPVIGAVVSGAVAVLVVLVTNGLVPALVVLGVVIGVQQLEGNVLQPLLLGRAVKLNGMAVVLAVAVGSVIAGIAGAVLAVPLLAVLNASIRALVSGDAEPDDRPGAVGSAFPPADVPADPDPLVLDPLVLDPLVLDPLVLDPLVPDPLVSEPPDSGAPESELADKPNRQPQHNRGADGR